MGRMVRMGRRAITWAVTVDTASASASGSGSGGSAEFVRFHVRSLQAARPRPDSMGDIDIRNERYR